MSGPTTKQEEEVEEVRFMTIETRAVALAAPSISHPISLFHRIWSVAGLGVAVIATVVWSGFLGYELFRSVF
jgi:hypothetical protein